MNIDEIKIVSVDHSPLDLQIYRVEKYIEEYNFYHNFPEDYLSLVEMFGEGIFADYIRIFPPLRAIQLTKIWSKNEHKCEADFQRFGMKKFINPLEVVDELMIIGDTLDGDLIFFWKENYYVYQIQVVPFIKKLGSNITNVFEYYEGDEGWEAIEINKFTPFDSQLITESLGYILGCHIV